MRILLAVIASLVVGTFAIARADMPPPPSTGCAHSIVQASIVNAASPDYPESAHHLALGVVTAFVEAKINPDGTLNALSIFKTSGNMAIDQAALRAARASTYAPKLVNCVAMTGDYFFRAELNTGPTPAPACANPFRDIAVSHAAEPRYPDSARSRGLGAAVVLVEVTIGPKGNLVGEMINRSSGDVALDMAALVAARESTYTTKLVNCVPTYGEDIVRVMLDPSASPPPPVLPHRVVVAA